MDKPDFYDIVFNALQKQAEEDRKRKSITTSELPQSNKIIPTPQPKNDPVNHPAHYTYGKIETIDFIRDKKLNFALGNAIKYIVRAGHKNDAIEDLQKAIWYINNEIETLKKNL